MSNNNKLWVERHKWQTKNGQEHERIVLFADGYDICPFTLDQAEQIGRDLLRHAAELRGEAGR